MADEKSHMQQQLTQLKTELMRAAVTAMFNGLHPLGALTASLAAIDEQVYGILRGAILKQRELSSDSPDAMEEYYAIVQELMHATQAHVVELHALARRQVPAPQAEATVQREVTELQRLFDGLDMHTRKPS